MCGIFGMIVASDSGISSANISKCLNELALRSITRGKDSSGIIFKSETENALVVLKGAVPISSLLKTGEFSDQLKNALSKYASGETFQVMGHARLATNGSQLLDDNNQPVIKSGIAGIHNGIIVNADQLWNTLPQVKREYEIDTEILLALVRTKLDEGQELSSAVSQALSVIEGTV